MVGLGCESGDVLIDWIGVGMGSRLRRQVGREFMTRRQRKKDEVR